MKRTLSLILAALLFASSAVSCGKTQSSKAEWGTALPYLKCVESSEDALSDNYLKITTNA